MRCSVFARRLDELQRNQSKPKQSIRAQSIGYRLLPARSQWHGVGWRGVAWCDITVLSSSSLPHASVEAVAAKCGLASCTGRRTAGTGPLPSALAVERYARNGLIGCSPTAHRKTLKTLFSGALSLLASFNRLQTVRSDTGSTDGTVSAHVCDETACASAARVPECVAQCTLGTSHAAQCIGSTGHCTHAQKCSMLFG